MNWKLLVIVFIAVLNFQARSQVFRDITNPSPKAERIFTKSLENDVVLVQQYYQLRGASGQLYGRDTLQYFGHYVTPGIWVDSFLVLLPDFMAPWQLDSNYVNRYADVDSLTPVKSHTLLFSASRGTADTLALRLEDSLFMEEMEFLIFRDTVLHQGRLGLPYEISDDDTVVEPFFILVYRDPLSTDSLKFKLKIHFSAIVKSYPSSNIKNLLSAPDTQGLLGGYYIWPVVSNHYIQLFFKGFLRKNGSLFEMHPLHLIDSPASPSGLELNPINEN